MNPGKHKIKISLLWIIFAVSASAAMITWLVEPGIIENIISKRELASEKLTTGKLLLFAFWWLIPLSMAFLTQVLTDTLNRRANLIAGITFALFTIYYFINLLLKSWLVIPNLLILIFSFIVTILIIWYSWHIEEKEA
jgi:hypothetical protein